MRVSIWKQDRHGARWYRVGVIEYAAAGALPFKRPIPHGDSVLRKSWPRVCWYSLETHTYEQTMHERRS